MNVQKETPELSELVSLLRDTYWNLGTNGAEAMSSFWGEMATNREGFATTAEEMGVAVSDFARAGNLLAEWLRANELLFKSPMEVSLEIRGEKLKLPDFSK